ncbi:MAG: DNA-directed RNA polymerase subunit alpha [Planctomycetota bacterium]|jgi:DNA-directed RNA polymerase subunit alpha|nr:DNA-directed RNA polymerase subunit alpha [Planctomycetota bacterium]
MRIRWKGFELPTRVVMDTESATDIYGKFTVEPFERGFGVTIGNSLRRVLLSSLEGVAPVSLRLEGALHEFSAMPGIVEDVIDIALNVKEMLVSYEGDATETLRVEKSGPGPVLAGDFMAPAGVSIVNKSLHIATLSGANTVFKAEVEFRKGRGYVRSEDFPWKAQDAIGVIPLDASFSPVRRSRWRVVETRVSKVTDYDRLILEIWTDGTIRPEQALIEASTILRKHLNPFVKYYELGGDSSSAAAAAAVEAKPGAERTLRDSDVLSEKLDQPVSVLEPSVRAANCLATEGINSIRDLVSRNEQDMLHVRNFGKTSLKEIKQKLIELGLSFGMIEK